MPHHRVRDTAGHTSGRSRATRAVTVLVATLLMMTGLALVTAAPAAADIDPPAGTPATVTADPLPTVQHNGVVWSQVVVGDTVYAGGSFTKVRPAGAAAGTNEVTRNNLMAYDIETGELVSSFAPDLNAQVRVVAASPDGSRLYVGGDFTQANGQTRSRIAAYSTATGQLVASFAPLASTTVRTITATNSTVYLGGDFRAVSGVARSYVAAVSAADGAVLDWNPGADAPVTASTLSYDRTKLVLGGRFTTLGGEARVGMGSVDPTTGAANPWQIQETVQNYGTNASITSLTADADGVYGTGYHFGGGGHFLEGTFRADPDTGAVVWIEDCHGDTYSAYAAKDAVYTASHAHYCGNIGGFPQTNPWTFWFAGAFSKQATGTMTADPYGYPSYTGIASPSLLSWFPNLQPGTYTGQSQAGWSVTGNGDYVVYGGEFLRVNNGAQQGLVRFAVKSKAPQKVGPRYSAGLIPRVATLRPGQARVSFTTTWDYDNEAITYKVYRNFQSLSDAPVYQTTEPSKQWVPKTLGFVDDTVVAGKRYNYRVYAYDSSGNYTTAAATVVDIPTTVAQSAYADAVLADSPDRFYRLDEASGSTVFDWAGFKDAVANASVVRGQAGGTGDADTATLFDGSDSLVVDPVAVPGPDTFSVEGWFKTASTTGGKIVGFGNASSGRSSSYDRHVYMDGSGKVVFGVYPGSMRTVSSAKAYNDGQWHYFVASLGSQGMQLSLDGRRVASRTDVTNGQAYSGYWRVGGDTSWGGDAYFDGVVDDVATYPAQLSKQQVNGHWMASGRPSALPVAPGDSYGATVFNDDPDLYWRLGEAGGTTAADSSSSQNDGTIYSGVTLGRPGITGADTAARLSAPRGNVVAGSSTDNPSVFSQEVWVKTTTTRGGRILGFGRSGTSDTSSSYDRHLYMLDNGKVRFGVYNGNTVTVESQDALNDGQWHHLVSTVGPDGMKLYVDGRLDGTDPNTVSESYTGYWKLGGDNAWGGNTDMYFDGDVDEAAIYGKVLSLAQVQAHYEAGGGTLPNNAPSAAFGYSVADLEATFDSSGSSDSDGTIASYLWDFGDGATSTQPNPTHSYQAAGSYPVTLTVKDGKGATGEVSHVVTVVAPNVKPVAGFTRTVTDLTAAFESTSTDSDGTVASYAWNFGDGATSTQPNPTHTYAAGGDYTVRLTVTDDRGGTDTVTRTVTVLAPNLKPAAAFSSTAADLKASFDASGSSDSDGTIASYDWAFGDGATGSGQKPEYAYASAGTYPVRLTVTDNRGDTDSVTQQVTVTAPPAATTIAKDQFSRTSTSGWGTADVGGPWTVTGGASNFTVGSGLGSMRIATAGASREAFLGSVSKTDIDLTTGARLSSMPTGGGTYFALAGRGSSANSYLGKVRVQPNGAVTLFLARKVAGSETTLVTRAVTGLTYVQGDTLQLRMQVTGTSPTAVKLKVWKAGTAEPSGWDVATTDATAALQQAGALGLWSYLSGSATTVPVTVRYTALEATSPATQPVNVKPVAAFTSTSTDLAASFDASGSSDSDGSVASYAWDFGDGSTGSGAKPGHPYAAAGTYQVRLTVTDDDGATDSVTQQVTVTAPATGSTFARDLFSRTQATGWGTADLGGAWTLGGSSSYYSVGGGLGSIRITGAGTGHEAFLGSVSRTDVDLTTGAQLESMPTGGGTYFALVGRGTSADNYRGKVRVQPNGAVTLFLTKKVAGTETALVTQSVPGVSYAQGDTLLFRMQVTGTTPTTVRLKVWKAGTTEPTAWDVTTTDSTAALQKAGGIGLWAYLTASSTGFPTKVGFTALEAKTPN